MGRWVLGLLLSMCGLLQACIHNQDSRSLGMSLSFINKGPDNIVVRGFNPDGQRGPVPGYLGFGGSRNDDGKEMSFMPGDSKRGVPKFVDVEWVQETELSKRDEPSKVQTPTGVNIGQREWDAYYKKRSVEFIERRLHYTRRVDLAPILTPELLAKVRANPSTTHLKLTVVFKDDDVSLIAEADVWKQGKYAPSDSSPAAMAQGRLDFQEAQAIGKKAFFVQGHFTGTVAGDLTGKITLNIYNSGVINAVIKADSGQTFVLAGGFDAEPYTPVRTLQLSGKDAQGQAIKLIGEIDLKAQKLSGTWQSSAAGAQTTGTVEAAR